jgi:hypothetical protein
MEKDSVVSGLGLARSCLLLEYLRDGGGEVEAGYCRSILDVQVRGGGWGSWQDTMRVFCFRGGGGGGLEKDTIRVFWGWGQDTVR